MSFYFFALCYEIYLRAKSPLDGNYAKRAIFYHIVSLSIPLAVGILLFFLADSHAAYEGTD